MKVEVDVEVDMEGGPGLDRVLIVARKINEGSLLPRAARQRRSADDEINPL